MHSRNLVLYSFSFTTLVASLIASSLAAAPVPPQKKTEVDPASIEAYQRLGAEFGYFIPDVNGTTFSFVNEQNVGPSVGAIPGFKWNSRPEDGFGEFPEVDVPFGIDLFGMSVSDEEIKPLRSLKNLTILNLGNSLVTHDGLVEIAKMPKLIALDLSNNQLNDEDLKLLKSLKYLKSLQLYNTQITDKSMKELASFEELIALNIQMTQVTDSGVHELHKFKKLQGLNIDQNRVTDGLVKDLSRAGILHILQICTTMEGRRPKNREEVERVTLYGCPITNETLKEFAEFKNIKELFVDSPAVDDDGLQSVGRMEKLTQLGLMSSSLTRKGIKELGHCKNLNSFILSQHLLSDDILQELKKLGLLYTLSQFTGDGQRPKGPEEVLIANLSGTHISEVGLRELGEFKRIHTLVIDQLMFTAASFKALNSSGLLHALQFAASESGGRPTSNDDVRSLNLPGIVLSSDALEELTPFKNLTTMSIWCSTIDESAAAALAKFTKLEQLNLQCDSFTLKAASLLAELKSLKSLPLNMRNLNDETFVTLIKSKLLLKVAGVEDKDGGVPSKLEDTSSLNLTGTRLTDASIKELAALPGLQSLILDGTLIEGREFKKLADLKHLTKISLARPGPGARGRFGRRMRLGDGCLTLEGLKELKNVQTLKEINLVNSPILNDPNAKKALEELAKALPECRIDK